MPELGGCLMPDLRKAHVTATPQHARLRNRDRPAQGYVALHEGQDHACSSSQGAKRLLTQQQTLPVRSAGDI